MRFVADAIVTESGSARHWLNLRIDIFGTNKNVPGHCGNRAKACFSLRQRLSGRRAGRGLVNIRLVRNCAASVPVLGNGSARSPAVLKGPNCLFYSFFRTSLANLAPAMSSLNL